MSNSKRRKKKRGRRRGLKKGKLSREKTLCGWPNLPCLGGLPLGDGLIFHVKCDIIYIDTIKFPVDLGQYTLNALGYVFYYIDKKIKEF